MPHMPDTAMEKRTVRPKPAWLVVGAIFISIWMRPLSAAELKSETVRAWDQYLQWANEKVRRELSDQKIFLIQNGLPPGERKAVQKQLESGEIVVRRMAGVVPPGVHFDVPSGEIHHWWGAILLRNVTLEQLMKFLHDYDHHAGRFSDVERSRIISAQGNYYKIFFRLRRSKAFVTAYYNTEQDCTYTYYDSNRASSQSVATKIAELEDPGTNSEREKPPGNDRGFLWRLVSWWRYEQKGNDVVLELESASLSRDIPIVVKLIPGVSSYIRATPKETLESVLTSIQKYVKQQ